MAGTNGISSHSESRSSTVRQVEVLTAEGNELGVLWSRRCVMERRQFTREFKLEAVRLIKERGVSYAQASEDLGVHPTQLRNWGKQLADDPPHAVPGQGPIKAGQLGIGQLKPQGVRP